MVQEQTHYLRPPAARRAVQRRAQVHVCGDDRCSSRSLAISSRPLQQAEKRGVFSSPSGVTGSTTDATHVLFLLLRASIGGRSRSNIQNGRFGSGGSIFIIAVCFMEQMNSARSVKFLAPAQCNACCSLRFKISSQISAITR